jgi:hypothetical protein
VKDPKILRWACLLCGVAFIYQGIDAISSRNDSPFLGAAASLALGIVWLTSGLSFLALTWKVHKQAGAKRPE